MNPADAKDYWKEAIYGDRLWRDGKPNTVHLLSDVETGHCPSSVFHHIVKEFNIMFSSLSKEAG